MSVVKRVKFEIFMNGSLENSYDNYNGVEYEIDVGLFFF